MQTVQQFPTTLGPAVNRGKYTTHKTLETMCNARAGPKKCWKSCANESNIVVTCSAGVFIGRANVLLAKAHVETRKEGKKWVESNGAG